jgi:hypothetical protein
MTILNSLIGVVLLMAQTSTSTPPAPIVQGGNMLMLTANLDRSVEFYRDFIGLAAPANAIGRQYAPVTAGLARSNGLLC